MNTESSPPPTASTSTTASMNQDKVLKKNQQKIIIKIPNNYIIQVDFFRQNLCQKPATSLSLKVPDPE